MIQRILADRLSSCPMATAFVLLVLAAFAVATAHGAVVLPDRRDVLFLCNDFCQHPALYATPPTAARELDIYSMSVALSSNAALWGGSLFYIGDLEFTSSPSAVLTLISAKLRSSRIGAIVCFSDTKFLDQLAAVLGNTSVAFGTWNGDRNAELPDEQKYLLLVFDDLASVGGAHLAGSHAFDDSFTADGLTALFPFKAIMNVAVLATANDLFGYIAGAAAAKACLALLHASGPPCTIGVLFQSGSTASRITRAGFNQGLYTSANLTSPSFASSGSSPTTTLPPQASADAPIRLVGVSVSHRDLHQPTATLEWLMESMSEHAGAPLDIVVVDSLTTSLAGALADVVSRSTRNMSELQDGFLNQTRLPWVVSLYSDTNLVASVLSSTSPAMPAPIVSLVSNATTLMTTVAEMLWASVRPNGAIGAAVQVPLVASFAARGRCIDSLVAQDVKSQRPSDNTATVGSASSSCFVWRLVLRDDPHGVTILLPASSVARVSLTGSESAAAMRSALFATAAAVASDALPTFFDYRALRLRTEASGSFTSESYATPSEMLTTIRHIAAFGAPLNLELLNPLVVASPAGPQEAILVVPGIPRFTSASGAETSRLASTKRLYATPEDPTGFYWFPLRVLRFDLMSNSLDPMLPQYITPLRTDGSGSSSSFSSEALTLRGANFTYTPYQAVAASKNSGKLYLFGGQSPNKTILSKMISASLVSASIIVEFMDENVSGPAAPSPRQQAQMVASDVDDRLYLYGGKCFDSNLCEDLWEYNTTARQWALLSGNSTANTSSSGSPPTSGRYDFGWTYIFQPPQGVLTRFNNSHWLIMAGGAVDHSIRIFAIDLRLWLSTAPPASLEVDTASIAPCVTKVADRVVFTLYPLGKLTAVILVLHLVDLSWGALVATNWTTTRGRCAPIAQYYQSDFAPPNPAFAQGQTSLIAGSGGAAEMPLSLQEFVEQDCSAEWSSNQYTSTAGNSCETCPRGTYSSSAISKVCVACPPPPLDRHPSLLNWQVAVCYGDDGDTALISFAFIAFVQFIAVPILVVLTNAISRSQQWEEDEQLVTEMCDAITDMMLERVAFLEHLEQPSPIQRALASCVAHIKTYRRLIPSDVLSFVDYVAWRARNRLPSTTHYDAGRATNASVKPNSSGAFSVSSASAVAPSAHPSEHPGTHAAAALRYLQSASAASGDDSDSTSESIDDDDEDDDDDETWSTTTSDSDVTHTELPGGGTAVALSTANTTPTSSAHGGGSTSLRRRYAAAGAAGSGTRVPSQNASTANNSSTRTAMRLSSTRSQWRNRALNAAVASRAAPSVVMELSATRPRGRSTVDDGRLSLFSGSARGGVATASVLSPMSDSASPYGVSAERVTGSILRRLEPKLQRRRVAVMWLEVQGLAEWLRSLNVEVCAAELSVSGSPGALPRPAAGATTANDANATHGGTLQRFLQKYNHVMDGILDVIHRSFGVPDAIFGDTIVATWDAFRPTLSRAHRDALDAAHEINTCAVVRSVKQLRISGSVAAGHALVGVLGGDGIKRPVVVGPLLEECHQLALCAAKIDVGILVKWNKDIASRMVDEFVFRIIGQGHFYHSNRGAEGTAPTSGDGYSPSSRRETEGGEGSKGALENGSASAAAISDTVGSSTLDPRVMSVCLSSFRSQLQSTAGGRGSSDTPRTVPGFQMSTVALLAELLGPSSLSQWQYELKGHREHVDAMNTVMRTVHDGRVEDARKIPLPKSLPKWFQAEMDHITSTGVLPTYEVFVR